MGCEEALAQRHNIPLLILDGIFVGLSIATMNGFVYLVRVGKATNFFGDFRLIRGELDMSPVQVDL